MLLMGCREMVGRKGTRTRPSPPGIQVSSTWHPGLCVLILNVRGPVWWAVSSLQLKGIQRLLGERLGLRVVATQPQPSCPARGDLVYAPPPSLRTGEQGPLHPLENLVGDLCPLRWVWTGLTQGSECWLACDSFVVYLQKSKRVGSRVSRQSAN